MSGHLSFNSINSQALANLNSSFGQFVADKQMDDNTIVKADRWSLTGVKSLKSASGDYRGNLFRSTEQISDNNAVRNAFLKTVSDIYGGEDHIPESVKKAMKAGDFDGKGRPLTARRIRATLAAIRTDIDYKKIADAVESQEFLFGDQAKFIKQTRPDLIDAMKRYTDNLTNEILDAMKTTILPDIAKGKAPSVSKMLRFLEVLERSEKPETRNIISESDWSILSRGGNERNIRNAAFANALVRNEALLKFFFSGSNAAIEATRNLRQASNEFVNFYDRDSREDMDKWDTRNERFGNFGDHLFNVRHFAIADLPPNEIHALLVKMADEQGLDLTESEKGTMTLAATFTTIEMLPNPEQRAVARRFLREVGQAVLDGTIRPRKHHTQDALYGVMINNLLLEQLEQCRKNCMKNAKNGSHDLPETVMGTPELDAQLLQRVRELKAEGDALRAAAKNLEK